MAHGLAGPSFSLAVNEGSAVRGPGEREGPSSRPGPSSQVWGHQVSCVWAVDVMCVCVCRVCIKRLWLVRVFTVSSGAARIVSGSWISQRPSRKTPSPCLDDVAAAGWARLCRFSFLVSRLSPRLSGLSLSSWISTDGTGTDGSLAGTWGGGRPATCQLASIPGGPSDLVGKRHMKNSRENSRRAHTCIDSTACIAL